MSKSKTHEIVKSVPKEKGKGWFIKCSCGKPIFFSTEEKAMADWIKHSENHNVAVPLKLDGKVVGTGTLKPDGMIEFEVTDELVASKLRMSFENMDKLSYSFKGDDHV